MPEPATITDAAGFIRRGELSPVELLEQCLARIDRYEDRVRAWVYLDRDGASEQAERLTVELKQHNYRGPLHGIPIGIKDIIDVFDMPTGCGSKLWANSYARRDATVVERLRQAGAVIMGKTVTTAFASFDPPVTRNPWNLDRTPGGSSSGSAAAVACGMCLGALATQTGGSITRPAAYCGVYSIKPTYGRVSVDGVLPLAPSMDHVGAMANCVWDLALLFQAIIDPEESVDWQRVAGDLPLQHDPYRRSRLVTLPDLLPGKANSAMLANVAGVSERLQKHGWSVGESSLPPLFADVPAFHHTVMAVEAAAYHAERMRRHPDDYPPKIRSLIETGLSTSATDFMRVKSHMTELRENMRRSFPAPRVALLTPATTSAAPLAESTGDPALNSPWSYSGQPTISVPVSWTTDGMPVALQLVGRSRGESDLFTTAVALANTINFERRPVPL